MPITRIERRRLERALARFAAACRAAAPPRELDYRFEGDSVVLFEPAASRNVARATRAAATGKWRVYWSSEGHWDAYTPHFSAASLEEFLALVREDPHGHFR